MKNSGFFASIVSLAIVLVNVSVYAQNHEAVFHDRQVIILKDFKASGFILDIGGGGEGVIGQLKGDQVISIDLFKEELVNAPSTNLKIVMDGRDLKFIDNTFNTVVIFYTLMYIDGADHEKVFNEVKRVLKHGGKLMIWDVNLPVSKYASKSYGIYRFKFKLPKTEINTGYGARFPKNNDQNLKYYMDLGKKSGFKVLTAHNNHPSFYLELQTPPAITDTLVQLIGGKGIDAAIKCYEQLKQSEMIELLKRNEIFDEINYLPLCDSPK